MTYDVQRGRDLVADRHLDGCRECMYDQDCTACSAGVGGSHGCNCGKAQNFGWQLNETLRLIYAAEALERARR